MNKFKKKSKEMRTGNQPQPTKLYDLYFNGSKIMTGVYFPAMKSKMNEYFGTGNYGKFEYSKHGQQIKKPLK